MHAVLGLRKKIPIESGYKFKLFQVKEYCQTYDKKRHCPVNNGMSENCQII